MNTQPNTWRSRFLVPMFASGIALLGLMFFFGRAAAENNVRVAQPAPAFVLKEPHGKTIKLTDFRNKALIVCFVATWDKPSRKQMAILNDMVDRYGETNLAVLALAVDQREPGSVKAFAEKQHLRYALHVADYDLIQTFGGLTSIPITFVIDKNQNVIDKYVAVTETNALDADVRAILKQ